MNKLVVCCLLHMVHLRVMVSNKFGSSHAFVLLYQLKGSEGCIFFLFS